MFLEMILVALFLTFVAVLALVVTGILVLIGMIAISYGFWLVGLVDFDEIVR